MKCPACGFDNIEGVDRCEDCMEPFRNLDVPQPKEGFQAHLMLDPVHKLFSAYPAAVGPDDSVAQAVDIMRRWRAGCVMVIKEERVTGILTEIDLLMKLGATDRDLTQIKVSELMTPNPETVEEDSMIASALHLMSVGGYRHVPVVRDGNLVGVVSIKDVLRYLKEHLL